MKRVAVVTLLIVATLMMTEFPCQVRADGVYGCYTERDGELQIVDNPKECKSKDGSIYWNQAGLRHIGGIKVFDANGQFLGMLLEPTSMEIFIPSLSRAVQIRVDNGDIAERIMGPAWPTIPFFFESSDCTGQIYLNASWSYRIFENGGEYYTGRHLAPVGIQIKSIFMSMAKLPPLCYQNDSVVPGLVPAIKISQMPFTLPAALPFRFEY